MSIGVESHIIAPPRTAFARQATDFPLGIQVPDSNEIIASNLYNFVASKLKESRFTSSSSWAIQRFPASSDFVVFHTCIIPSSLQCSLLFAMAKRNAHNSFRCAKLQNLVAIRSIMQHEVSALRENQKTLAISTSRKRFHIIFFLYFCSLARALQHLDIPHLKTAIARARHNSLPIRTKSNVQSFETTACHTNHLSILRIPQIN